MTWTGLLLTLAVTARLTRLITNDTITQPIRTWAVTRYGGGGWLPTLLHCSWCSSVWIAFPAAIGSHYWHDDWRWQTFAAGCAASWLYAIAAYWLDDTDTAR